MNSTQIKMLFSLSVVPRYHMKKRDEMQAEKGQMEVDRKTHKKSLMDTWRFRSNKSYLIGFKTMVIVFNTLQLIPCGKLSLFAHQKK